MKIKHAELGSATFGGIAVVVPGFDAGHVELHHDHIIPVHRQVLSPVFRVKTSLRCCKSTGRTNLEWSDYTF